MEYDEALRLEKTSNKQKKTKTISKITVKQQGFCFFQFKLLKKPHKSYFIFV